MLEGENNMHGAAGGPGQMRVESVIGTLYLCLAGQLRYHTENNGLIGPVYC